MSSNVESEIVLAAEQGVKPAGETPDTDKSRNLKWWLMMASLLSSLFIYALDTTIVADLIPVILLDLDGIGQLAWVSAGFSLGGITSTMPFGKLYTFIDPKTLYIGSVVAFMGASALCAAGANINTFIVGRVLAGASGNGIYLGVLTILSTHTTERERPLYLGSTGLVWGIGTVLGPIVGGSLAKINWRWAFYLNLFIGTLSAPIYLFCIPKSISSTKESLANSFLTLDLFGILLSTGAMVALFMAINFGGVIYEWTSAQEIALFTVGGVLLLSFLTQQTRSWLTTISNRVFPIHLVLHKEATLLFIAMASISVSGFTVIFYLPLYFQLTRDDTSILAAVRLLPFLSFLSVSIIGNGFLLSKGVAYKPWYIVGSTMALIGAILLSRMDDAVALGLVYALEIVLGVGIGSIAQCGYAIIQAIVPTSETANSRTYMMIAQLTGIGFGLAISGAIFVNCAMNGLEQLNLGLPHDDLQQLISGSHSAHYDIIDASVRTKIRLVVVAAIQKVFVVTYVSAAVSFLCGLMMRWKKLGK